MKNRLALMTIVVLMFIFSMMPIAKAESNLTVDIKFGFQNEVSTTKTMPIYIEIKNSGQDFSGDFVYDNELLYNGGTGMVFPINIKAGESDTIKFYIKGFSDNTRTLKEIKKLLHIYEGSFEKGEEVSFQLVASVAPKSLTFETQHILAITPDENVGEQFKGADFNTTYTIYVSKATSKEQLGNILELRDLMMFDLIAVDKMGAAFLSKEQLQLLSQWQSLGGTVMLLNNAQLDGFMSPLQLKDDKQWDVKLETFGEGIFGSYNKGMGKIVETSFALNDTAIENKDLRNMLKKALSIDASSNKSVNYNDSFTSLGWIYNNGLFDTFYYNTGLILLFLLFYIVAVGPLLYYVLKKKDKREKMWLYIPILAVVASLLLFVFGAKDRITKPHSQTMELITLNGEGGAEVNTAYSFLSTKRAQYAITNSQNFSMASSLESFDPHAKDIHDYAFTTFEDDQTLHFKDVPYWSVKSAVAQGYLQNVGQLSSDLQVKDKHIVGTVTNGLSVTIDDLQVLSGRYTVSLGKIEAGQTLEVNEPVEFSIVAKPYVSQNYEDDFNLPAKEKVLENRKSDLINAAVNTYNMNQPLLVGWSTQPLSDIQLSKNSKATALVAYTQTANIETILDGAVSIMSEDVLPTIKTLNATGYADLLEDVPLQAMVSEGEFEVSYPISQISQQPIEWKQFDVNFDPTMLHVEIYNAKKDMYESVSTSPWQQTKNIDSYVTETQEILFKLRATSEYINSYVELPTFTLKGVAKND